MLYTGFFTKGKNNSYVFELKNWEFVVTVSGFNLSACFRFETQTAVCYEIVATIRAVFSLAIGYRIKMVRV